MSDFTFPVKPKDIHGRLRPNHHYDLCACGAWKKNASRSCRGCRKKYPRDPARPGAWSVPCVCGKWKRRGYALCQDCRRGLCSKGLHPRTEGYCRPCRRDRYHATKAAPRPRVAPVPRADVARVTGWPAQSLTEIDLMWRYCFG